MSNKHTPGPWVVVDPISGGYAVQSALMTSEARNGGYVSAVCPGPDGRANARLITAAPEMLDAGEPLADLVRRFAGPDDALISVSAGELRALARAIAKARGR